MTQSSVMLPNNQKPYRQSIFDNNPRLPESALFDKVINIAIHRNGKPDIVIRSDYDIVTTAHKKWFSKEDIYKAKYDILRCKYKPSLQVKFNVLTSNIASEIDLFITNFFIFTGEGSMSLYDFMASETEKNGTINTHYPITGVDIIIGYASQFPKPRDADEYFTIDATNPPLGASGLRMSEITFCSYDKAPPNSIFHISGKVSAFRRLVKSIPELSPTLIKFNSPIAKDEVIEFKKAEDLFEDLIEKRFIRDNYAWSNASAKDKKLYTTGKGTFTKSGAKKFGCKVIIPDASELNNFWFNYHRAREGKVKQEKTPLKCKVPNYVTPDATFQFIKDNFIPGLQWTALINGNFVVWLENDLVETVKKDGETVKASDIPNAELKDLKVKPSRLNLILSSLNEAVSSEMPQQRDENTKGFKFSQNEYGAIIIPAVQSVAVSAGDVIIKCPFFSLLNPFSKIMFNSRYNLADYTRYLTRGGATQATFNVISYCVDFSTTGKENTVAIRAIDTFDYLKILSKIKK